MYTGITCILSSLLSYVQIISLFVKEGKYSHVNECSRMPSAGDRTSVMLYSARKWPKVVSPRVR
jgi:hypothetical protein